MIFTVGMGVGAQAIICTDANGHVSLETMFNRCCNGDESEQRDATIAETDDCSDRLDEASKKAVASRATHQFVPLYIAQWIPVTTGLSTADSPAVRGTFLSSKTTGSPPHAPVEFIIFRC